MTRGQLKELIRQCVQDIIKEENLDEGSLKHLAALGLAGASLYLAPHAKALADRNAQQQSNPAMTQTVDKSNPWSDIEKETNYRDRVAKEIGPFAQRVMKQKAFFGGK